MNDYLDIRLLPDADFSPPVLMNALYAKLHRVLVAQQRSDIGVSFPGYALAQEDEDGKKYVHSLGLTLRLHGKAAALDRLMASRWVTGFSDHSLTGHILPVPANTHHIRVLRRQAKSSPARERDRLMRRKNITLEEACRRIPDSLAKRLDFPFLTVDSSSTGQRFHLFIEQQVVTEVTEGSFNAYGLSACATLPQW